MIILKTENDAVLYKTAFLAKEKGFDIPVKRRWIHNTTEPLDDEYWIQHFNYPVNFNIRDISAPTQSELQKLLREKHGIHIVIEPGGENFDLFTGYCCKTQQDVINRELENISKGYEHIKFYSSYEEALEEMLYNALNLIK